MRIYNLLEDATGTGAGQHYFLGSIPFRKYNSIPIAAWVSAGSWDATIKIQGTIWDNDDIDNAVWVDLDGGTFTAAAGKSLECPFTHIRANVTVYVSGTIQCRFSV